MKNDGQFPGTRLARLLVLARNRQKNSKTHQSVDHVQRAAYKGIGKPEPLKHEFSGFWSRRIDDEHRLVYTFIDTEPVIIQRRYHYD